MSAGRILVYGGRGARGATVETSILNNLQLVLNGEKLDAVFCVAGGWAGGNAEKNLVKSSELMWKQSVWTSIIAASLSPQYLKEGGQNSGLPKSSLVLTIVPVTLDTEANRKFMPTADYSTWTPLQFIANLFTKWVMDRPQNGTLIQLITIAAK